MKFSTATTSAVLLAKASTVTAFGPSPTFTQQHTQQRQHHQSTTRLSLINIDPILATSALESTSIMTASGVVETLGSLALLGSVGFGVFSGMKDPEWTYEYKVGNDHYEGEGDLALLEESPVSVLEKVEEETAAKPKPAAKEPVAAAKPEPVKPKPAAPAPAKAKPTIKANTPSKELLESTEKAKDAVQKKGVQETKDKMSSKSNSSTSPAAAEVTEVKAASTTEVAETKKPGGKRRFAKGVTLIAAAGAVAVARNVVKAYLGRGML